MHYTLQICWYHCAKLLCLFLAVMGCYDSGHPLYLIQSIYWTMGSNVFEGTFFFSCSYVATRNLYYSLSLFKKDNLWVWQFYKCLWWFFHHTDIYLSQNLIANGHFEVLNAFETQLDQKLQDKTKKILFLFFNFGRKNTENLRLINGHFLTTLGHFFANYLKIFLKYEVQTVILRCLS